MVSVGVLVDGVKDLECFFGEIFCCWDAVEDDGFMSREGGEEFDDLCVALVDEEGVIPLVEQAGFGQRLDFGEVHYHAVGGIAGFLEDFSGKRYFKRITVSVQMAALAFVVGNTMAGVEFQAAGDLHSVGCPLNRNLRRFLLAQKRRLGLNWGFRDYIIGTYPLLWISGHACHARHS